MVELTTRQWYYGHSQRLEFRLVYHGMSAEGATEIRIEIIITSLVRTGIEQSNCPVAEHPHAYVGKIETGLEQLIEFSHRGFL